jgi:Mismatch repair ATPase (MutS family)
MPQKTKDTPMMQQYLAIKKDYQDTFFFIGSGIFTNFFTMMPLKGHNYLS